MFTVEDPDTVSELYFPLANTQGALFSCITPYQTGDIKTSINNFLNVPQSACDLHSLSSTRSLWLCYDGQAVNTSSLYTEPEASEVEAGPLYHILRSDLKEFFVETLNFVPENAPAEVMRFTVTNKSKKDISVTPVFAMPLFCRSADNLRDHRHVTSLLSRVNAGKNCVVVRPTMAFDERGHTPNTMDYFVAGYRGNGAAPRRVIATYGEFVGEGGSMARPGYLVEGGWNTAQKAQGREPFAGFDFGPVTVKKGSSFTITVVMGMTAGNTASIIRRFDSPAKIDKALAASKKAWLPVFTAYVMDGGDPDFAFWSQWVSMQPTFRKIFGCSFLPHFDYGRGGRGWRDLWQDLLGLLLFDPAKTRQAIVNNFKGVRIDGSNATIIRNDGGFLADRNRISRVWMDHGVWPYLTLRLYLDQTGDTGILFEDIPYFKDNLLNRAKVNEPSFPEKDNLLRDRSGKPHAGSLFEHTLVQNLVQFFNVGEHGNTKLEDADWNDGLDMAHGKGESVAFTCMYAHNLRDMAALLRDLKKLGVDTVALTAETLILLDTLRSPVDYSKAGEKRALLECYYEAACRGVSGVKKSIAVEDVADDLEKKSESLTRHVRDHEWIKELGVYNGYYDNAGRKVEGIVNRSPRITLTSGVFAIMSGVATDEQVSRIHKSFGKYLLNKEFGTYRLNTDFREVKLDLGRAFAFSYGDKENGAVFAHMDVMLAFALYSRGFVREGFGVLNGLFKMATGDKARIYPCLSEYFNADDRGLYNYLTGSASWYTYLLITQSFGVRHVLGGLVISPRLVREQFGQDGLVRLSLAIDGVPCLIVYRNPGRKDHGAYRITEAHINGKPVAPSADNALVIPKGRKSALLSAKRNMIELTLA